MSVLDDLIAEVDVEAALADVLARHRVAVRHRRTQRALLVAACTAALVAATWLVWPDRHTDPTLDVAGEVDGQAAPTPASATVVGAEGLAVTVAVDDSSVAIGEVVSASITVENRGAATLLGAWSEPVDCTASIGAAVRVLAPDDRAISIGNLSHGDNAWFAGRADLTTAVTRTELVVPSLLATPMALTSPCPREMGDVPVERLEPGQTLTSSATWSVWIGPGALPDRARVGIEVNASVFGCEGCQEVAVATSSACPTCGETMLTQATLPLDVDLSGRLAPPSAEQLSAAVERTDVQAALDRFGPRRDAGPDPVFGGWLLQTGPTWTQRIQGGTGAVDIVFDAAGAVTEVRTASTDGAIASTCSSTPGAITAARQAIRTSPLSNSVDRAALTSIDQLRPPPGELVTTGRISGARPVVGADAGADGFPTEAETGITLAWAGAELVVTTTAGDVVVGLPLAIAGSTVLGPDPIPGTDALLGLEGACVVVGHGSGDTGPMAAGSPRILAVAPDDLTPPLPLHEMDDAALLGVTDITTLSEALQSGG